MFTVFTKAYYISVSAKCELYIFHVKWRWCLCAAHKLSLFFDHIIFRHLIICLQISRNVRACVIASNSQQKNAPTTYKLGRIEASRNNSMISFYTFVLSFNLLKITGQNFFGRLGSTIFYDNMIKLHEFRLTRFHCPVQFSLWNYFRQNCRLQLPWLYCVLFAHDGRASIF